MSYHAPVRGPIRRKQDPTALILSVVALVAIPALVFAFYKFVINKPPPKEEPLEIYTPPTAQRGGDPRSGSSSSNNNVDWAAGLPAQPVASLGYQGGHFDSPGSSGSSYSSSSSYSMSDFSGSMNVGVAVSQACKKIKESVDLNKTLVVWLVDASASCDLRRGEVAQQIGSLYPTLVSEADRGTKPEDAKLLTAVCSFASDVQFILEEPTADPSAVRSAVEGIKTAPGDVENTFQAIISVVDKYASYAAAPHQRYLTLVIVTDEVGSDQQERDRAAELLRKNSVPVFIIGQAASFGSSGAEATSAEGPGGVVTGPESRDIEAIRLAYPSGGMSRMGGGFEQCSIGPYSLSYLCRESGGEYYPIGSLAATVTLPPKYYPRYQTEKDYQAFAGSNKALQALSAASKLPAAKQVTGVRTSFGVDENGLAQAKDIDFAQRPVALIIPGLNDLFDTLKKGEADRSKLVEPRHQAAFDTALGRAMAAKVRTEGYIVLLAAFKAGRKTPSGGRGTWFLKPAEGIEKNSVLDGMAKKARQYLEGVVNDHPGTPWAQQAQQELAAPIGWEWVSR